MLFLIGIIARKILAFISCFVFFWIWILLGRGLGPVKFWSTVGLWSLFYGFLRGSFIESKADVACKAGDFNDEYLFVVYSFLFFYGVDKLLFLFQKDRLKPRLRFPLLHPLSWFQALKGGN